MRHILAAQYLNFLIFPGDEKPEHAEKSPLHFRKIEKKTYEKEFKELSGDEKKVLEKIIESQGTIFQSELADKENSKVKITRILDRLEGKLEVQAKYQTSQTIGMESIVDKDYMADLDVPVNNSKTNVDHLYFSGSDYSSNQAK